ncbi:MAG: TIGR00725 family protein [Myxococcota bacterium]
MSIIGGGKIDTVQACDAERLGQLAVEAGFRICCGGMGGVMAAACRGARQAANYQEGDTMGILPGLDRSMANPFVDIALPTSLGHGRNLLVVATGDVVVAIGGASGTLSEIALAWRLGRPIVVLANSGGWSSQLAGMAIDDRRTDRVRAAATPEDAIRIACVIST